MSSQPLSTNRFLEGLDTLFKQDRIEEVEPYFLDWLGLADEARNDYMKLTIFNEMMGFYRSSFQYDKALACANVSQRLIELLGLTPSVDLAVIMINIATVLCQAGDPDKAIPIYEQAMEILQSKDAGWYHLASLYNNMAEAYLREGDNRTAEDFYLRAWELASNDEGGYYESAVTSGNLAELYFILGNKNEAKFWLKTMEDIVESIREMAPFDYVTLCKKCALLYQAHGIDDKARMMIENAEELS